MSDVFREVDEDLRREQLKRLWRRYGWLMIGAAVLIVVAVAGYQILSASQQRQAAESGDQYYLASQLHDEGDVDGAEAIFAELAESGHAGYRTLAGMRVAAITAQRGENEEAAAMYDAIAIDPETDPALSDIARIRAGVLSVDVATLPAVRQRLEPFTDNGNPYRALALEIMAVAAIEAAEYELAMEWLIALGQDPFTDEVSASRANALFQVILSRREAPEPASADGAAGSGLLAPALQPDIPAVDVPPLVLDQPEVLEDDVPESPADDSLLAP